MGNVYCGRTLLCRQMQPKTSNIFELCFWFGIWILFAISIRIKKSMKKPSYTNRHEISKLKKYRDGGKQKVYEPLSCAQCGCPISNREDTQNEGLCNNCYDNITKLD